MPCSDATTRYAALRGLVVLWTALVLACHPQTDSRLTTNYQQGTHPAIAPDADFNRRLADTGQGWTGGDGTVSIQLPDGRTLWLFGDSFLGTIAPDGTRRADTPFIRNCALVESNGLVIPLYGQRDGSPAAFFQPAPEDEWYWPGDGTVQGDRLIIFLHRFQQMRPGLWGWQWTGTDLAILGLPDLTLNEIQPAPNANGIRYGTALLEHRDRIIIYGVAEKAGRKYLHVARTSGESLVGDSWLFFTGDQWSSDPGHSRPVLTGVSSQFSVIPFRQGFALITMDGRVPFSGRLVVYTAPRPEGPFDGPVFLYKAPEATSDVAAYSPFVHAQFTRQGRFLISYNVNHLHDPDALFRDARLYRPRFLRVDLSRFLPAPPKVEHEFGGRWGWDTSR